MKPHRMTLKMLAVTLGAVAIVAPLAGCGDDEETDPTDVESQSTTETSAPADVTVANVWVRPGTAGGNTAIYMDITAGSGGEELTKATVPADVAAKVELHETVMADTTTTGGDGESTTSMGGMHDSTTTTMGDMDGSSTTAMGDMDSSTTMAGGDSSMMKMQQVEKIEIPADSTVKLEPGGLHVMLFDLAKDLVAGDTVDVTLTFSGAGEQTITAEVKEP